MRMIAKQKHYVHNFTRMIAILTSSVLVFANHITQYPSNHVWLNVADSKTWYLYSRPHWYNWAETPLYEIDIAPITKIHFGLSLSEHWCTWASWLCCQGKILNKQLDLHGNSTLNTIQGLGCYKQNCIVRCHGATTKLSCPSPTNYCGHEWCCRCFWIRECPRNQKEYINEVQITKTWTNELIICWQLRIPHIINTDSAKYTDGAHWWRNIFRWPKMYTQQDFKNWANNHKACFCDIK